MSVLLKRAYDPPAESDGRRILVDRLWPRGLPRAGAGIDLWLREVAPTTELRKWFGHDPERWAGFEKRYRAELEKNPALTELRQLSRRGKITLVYAARDREHNHALILKQVLDGGA